MAYRDDVELLGPPTLGIIPLLVAAVPAVLAAVPAITKLLGKKKKKKKKPPPPPPPLPAAAPGIPGWVWPVVVGGGGLAVGALVLARRR